jgi:hypothetical protein
MAVQRKLGLIPVAVLGLLVAAMLSITGCSTDPEPTSSTGGGGDANITISTPTASPSDLMEGETSVIEVIVTDAADDPVADVSVDFVVSPAGGGYFTPPTATTDTSGIASTIFTSQQSGTMSIAASAEGKQSPYTAVAVTATGQQASGNLQISVTPGLLTADGASNATVTVTVLDVDQNPAPEGTTVKFAAGERFDDVDGNGYWTQNIDSLMFDYNANDLWDPIGMIPASAATDASGIATVTYTAGTEATTAYIKATVTGTTDYDGTIESSVQLTPDAEIYSIELSSDVTGMQVRHTGGIETTNMHAICYDVNGNRVPEGQAIDFVITDGPGGGENIAGQGYGPVTAYTNSNGVATVPVWSGTVSGTVRIYASSGTVLSNATFVAVYAGPPYYIAVGADFCNMDAWNTVNREQYVNSAVADIYHNPVQDTVVVYFTVDEGIIDAYGITEESTGVASAIFRTGEPQVDGIVWVWAETSGGTVVGSTYFINSYIPDHIYASILPTSLLANGKSNATYWADVRDLNDNFVIDETPVDAKTLYGTASSGGTTDGCHASIYEGEYRSATLDQDYSVTGLDDDGIGGIDVITIKSGFTSTSLVCTLTTAYAFAEESSLEMEGTSVPYGATNVPFYVVVKDRYGNPLADHTMTATATAGAIAAGTETQETNTFGEAFGFRYNAPADSTTGMSAIITVSDSDPRGGGLTLSTNVTFTAKK